MKQERDYRRAIFDSYTTHTYRHRTDLSTAGVEKNAAQHRRIAGEFLPEETDAPILDLGCGNGGFLLACRQSGYSDLTGVDISQEQVDFCHRLGFDSVEQGDALEYLSSSTRRYALIAMNDVLEHVPKERVLATLDSLHDHLIPGGRALVRVPNLSNPWNLRTRYVDFTHEVGFSKESLAQVLRVAGLEVESIRGVFSEDPRWPMRWIFDRLLWWLVVQIYRRTLHLTEEVVRGKNLLAVARRPPAATA